MGSDGYEASLVRFRPVSSIFHREYPNFYGVFCFQKKPKKGKKKKAVMDSGFGFEIRSENGSWKREGRGE